MMTNYTKEYLKPIIGKRIIGLIEDSESEFYVFLLEGGIKVWVSMDPEGNAPGHLDIDTGK